MTNLLLAVIYLAFISLGLPDALLGAAWPEMHTALGAPLSSAGLISMIISLGTIISSFFSDRLTYRFGTGKITAVSVLLTALALFGFSISKSFAMLALFAIPYGLGAGSVDASLNNYVALHYKSRHMSWLHCMWGVGAASGPYLMEYAIRSARGWNMGYRWVGFIQIGLTLILFASLRLWQPRVRSEEPEGGESARKGPMSLREVFAIPGAPLLFVCFFCYAAMEHSLILWSSSFLAGSFALDPAKAAGYGTLFCSGMTVGRFASGFLTLKFDDKSMIRIGATGVVLAVTLLFLPLGEFGAVVAIVLAGLGCAPIYPSIIHSTPRLFGAERSQAIIGMQMAFAYTGSLTMPPVFGLLAQHVSVGVFPLFLMVFLIAMIVLHELLVKMTARNEE